MPATANIKLPVRTGSGFGYPAAPGVHVFSGALQMFTAAVPPTIQPLGLAGGVAFAGVALAENNNATGTTPSSFAVELARGKVVKLAVPGAIPANIGAPVYATDDVTCTLSSNSGANVQIGTLAGFEGGATWVRIVN